MTDSLRPLVPVNTKGLDDVANSLLENYNAGNEQDGNAQQPLNIPANIAKADYIRIPQQGILISKKELYKGDQFKYNWEKSIFTLQENGLYMPSPAIFMNHFMNVKNAAEGKSSLQDGNGRNIPRNEAQNLWQYLSSTNRSQFNGETCWTWLDAFFKHDKTSGIYMETDHSVVAQGRKKVLQGKKLTLDAHITNQDGWAELSFNKQGLANKPSSQNGYIQGSNMYFWYPRKNQVAWFYADSGWAGLDCDRDPTGTNSSLGVFACAGGASAQKI